MEVKDYLDRNIGRTEEVDVPKDHLVLRKNDGKFSIAMHIKKLLDLSSCIDLQRKLQPKLSSHYVMLDKNYGTYLSNHRLRWLINTGSPIDKPGYANVNFPLSDITAIRLKKIIFIPIVEALFISELKTYSILLEELSAQSFIIPSTRYHFMMNYINGELSASDYNRGLYHFNSSIKYLDSITISMYNPIYPVDIKNNSQTLYILLEVITCDTEEI